MFLFYFYPIFFSSSSEGLTKDTGGLLEEATLASQGSGEIVVGSLELGGNGNGSSRLAGDSAGLFKDLLGIWFT